MDAVAPEIRELLEQWPDMSATVITERIGGSRSLTVLKERVRALRSAFQPVDPASRTVNGPGELVSTYLSEWHWQDFRGAGRCSRSPVTLRH
ncbi:hypothetical protein GCM10010245_92210 [Streptomyces spectabilis]|uniref:Uncharacterized protein n=1 Tax=Streptomyces spectabilis TaxID=68270 RepID=A0A7W8B632_STRST|nr:hypothetical protein [Streptomyces spectabilis]GGV59140.1 hypothetical protein GCM10010245_92210 [Streptomyces spectabilis]